MTIFYLRLMLETKSEFRWILDLRLTKRKKNLQRKRTLNFVASLVTQLINKDNFLIQCQSVEFEFLNPLEVVIHAGPQWNQWHHLKKNGSYQGKRSVILHRGCVVFDHLFHEIKYFLQYSLNINFPLNLVLVTILELLSKVVL